MDGQVTSNSQLSTEFSEVSAIKLLSIARDDDPQNPKPTNEVFPDEVLYLGLCDYCQRFCFYPLHKIVNSDD